MRISIHIRRGDYIQPKYAAIHQGPDLHYYNRALELYEVMFARKAHYFVFSDDMDYARTVFKDRPHMHFIDSDPQYLYEDMFLIGSCDHHIMANSTYGWWGAWLNQKPGKRVIAPYKWFARDFLIKNPAVDQYEDDWIILM